MQSFLPIPVKFSPPLTTRRSNSGTLRVDNVCKLFKDMDDLHVLHALKGHGKRPQCLKRHWTRMLPFVLLGYWYCLQLVLPTPASAAASVPLVLLAL